MLQGLFREFSLYDIELYFFSVNLAVLYVVFGSKTKILCVSSERDSVNYVDVCMYRFFAFTFKNIIYEKYVCLSVGIWFHEKYCNF